MCRHKKERQTGVREDRYTYYRQDISLPENRQTDTRPADTQTDKRGDRHRHADTHTNKREMDTGRHTWRDKHEDRQRYVKIDRQTD